MRERVFFVLLAAVLAAVAVPSVAQENPAAPAPVRQNVRENLSTLRLLRMTEALDLTEAQTVVIYPFLIKLEKDKFKIQRDMGADLRSLRALILDASAKEADILAKAKAVLEARVRIRAMDDEADQFLEKQLTGVQMGKYVLFQLDFYRGLENTFEQIRQRRGQMGPPPIKK